MVGSVSDQQTFCWGVGKGIQEGLPGRGSTGVATTVVQTTILSHPDHGNYFLTGIHAPTLSQLYP